jgi:hypothetical protein
MNRTCLVSVAAALVFGCWPAPALAQRCPFLMQQQFQMQQQMMQQQMMQQQQWQRQQRMMQRQQMQQQQQWQNQQGMMQRRQTGFTAQNARFTVQRQRFFEQRLTTFTRRTTTFTPARVRVPGFGRGHGTPWYQRMGARSITVRHATQRSTYQRELALQRLLVQRRTHRATRVRRAQNGQGGASQQTATRQNAMRTVDKGSTTQRQVQHTPRTQVRVNLTMTCGNCHNCKMQTPQAPTQAPRNPLPSMPIVRNPVQPILGPVINPVRPPVFPVVRPLPITRPPTLPPLVQFPTRPALPGLPTQGVTQLPARPLLPVDWMVSKPPAPDDSSWAPETVGGAPTAKPRRPIEGTARRPAPSSPSQKPTSPPDLPAPSLPPLAPQRPMLEPPGLITTADARPAQTSKETGYEPLMPDEVLQPPELPALPMRSPLQLALQPSLGETDAPSLSTVEDRPTTLDVVLRPPALPPLPETR